MTSQPEVPGADAVYLFREEITEDREGMNADTMDMGADRLNFRSVYVRLKVLTEAGKKYADVRIPYDPRIFSIGTVAGRTIHSDGAVVPFAGKPFVRVVEKSKAGQESETVFTMPDVQVGSILEYRYFLRYNSGIVDPPQWYIQQELFLRSGHYYFRPTKDVVVTGHDKLSSGVAYSSALPEGVAVKYIYSQDAYELNVRNIPPVPAEEWMPPLASHSHRVLFYYTGVHTAKEYWTSEGAYWSRNIDRFAGSPKLKDAVASLVAPSDSGKDKVKKIYDAVMGLENTSFTREHSAAENKSAGIKIKTADDIWQQKRGNRDEITLLFVAMVRAAGINAYAMAVTNRDRALFVPSYLTFDQLDDLISIVEIDGKEQYLDPGERYCPFGLLHWKHTLTGGLRQSRDGAVIATTTGTGYEDAETIRSAQLDLDADGKVQGIVRVKISGQPALYWRQVALSTDESEVKRQFEQSLQSGLPAGIQVKMSHFVGLADWNDSLLAVMDVSGVLGTKSSKRLFLPSSFFEASDRPLFAAATRESPVDLQYPSLVQDTVNITLPAGLSIETLPKDARIPVPKNALYVVKYTQKPGIYNSVRVMILANAFYQAKDYPDLRDFYQKVSTQDQQQTILSTGAQAAGQ
ncbi:MAG TPA: DUF3857 domain-containing protein [Acidisarcina sp.]